MARRHRFRFRRRRGTSSFRTHRRRGWGIVRIMKILIAFGPEAGSAYGQWRANGPAAAMGDVVQAYSGLNTATGQFDPRAALVRGYGPIIAAIVFGKIASRVHF